MNCFRSIPARTWMKGSKFIIVRSTLFKLNVEVKNDCKNNLMYATHSVGKRGIKKFLAHASYPLLYGF